MRKNWHLRAATLTCMSFAMNAAVASTDLALTITVHTDWYVESGRVYFDAGALQRHVSSIGPRNIEIQACGPGATAAWKSLVYRLRHFPLELRVLDSNDRDCDVTTAVVPVVERRARREEDMKAVDGYWREMMP